jgi:endonuclease-3
MPGARRRDFRDQVDALQEHHGPPAPPRITDPFEQVLWENVAYLTSDARRAEAFELLATSVGTTPQKILAASDEKLLRVARLGGMRPEDRVEKLRRSAEIARSEFGGKLHQALGPSLEGAKKALRRFPGIGEPGAEKILLFARRFPVLALESNGLRVLLRLGFGAEKKSYAATYRSVQSALQGQVEAGYEWLIAAHQLLRQHGQVLCRRSDPDCEVCPLSECCEYRARHVE